MRKLLAFALALGVASLVISSLTLKAQTTGGGALVVATCGTLGQQFAVGSTRQLTVNTSGQVCQ